MYIYYIPYIIGGKTVADLSMGSITISANTKICTENFAKSMQLIREKIVANEKSRHKDCTPDQVLIVNFILIPPFDSGEVAEAKKPKKSK